MTTRLDELQAALDAATTGPWDYDTTMTDGEYGDGGPDSHIGFRQFVIIDANGDTICDTTNRDGMLVEVVEHIDEDGWDARDVLGEIDAAAIVLLRNNASDLLAVARAAQSLANWDFMQESIAPHMKALRTALAPLTGHSDALQRLGDVMGHHDSKNGFVQFNSSYGGPPLFVQSDPRWVGTEGIKLFHSLLMAIRDAEREAYAAGIEHAKKCVDLALQQARR